MKTVSDQIKDLENTRASRVARMEEVAKKAMEEERSMDAAEQEEFDDLEGEIKQLDSDITRYRSLEKQLTASAAPVDTSEPEDKFANFQAPRRGPTIMSKPKDKDEDFKGQFFTRKAIARLVAKKEGWNAAEYAEYRWGKTNPTLVNVLKAAVPGHGGDSGEPGSELVTSDNRYNGDFVEFLYSQTVYNQLPLREVPANVAIKGQDGAATGYWVGESKAIPMSTADFSTVSLTYKKVAALTTMSMELMKYSDPSAEMLIRDALVQAASQRIDTTFIGTDAASAGVSPAGLLNGVSATTSAGTDIDGVVNDIKELRQRFIDAKNSSGLYWVMNPGLASSLSLLRNTLGQKEFTEINQNGGMLEGDPVVTGHNVDSNYFILLKPSDIWRIGMSAPEVSMSEHATIEQADDPAAEQDTPTAQANSPVNMFQTDSVAVKVVVPIDYQKRRTSAVQYINDADYGGAIST